MPNLERLYGIVQAQRAALQGRDFRRFQELLWDRIQAQAHLVSDPPEQTPAARDLIEDILLMDRAMELQLQDLLQEAAQELSSLTRQEGALRAYLPAASTGSCLIDRAS
ncbi:MAG: hypothetical protein HYY02_02095 [Chloroflexi bacterium]|nr:hypothetical protein [Chloroflexota bacterium]